jgi:hypothetical protein
VEDRIALCLGGSEELLEAARAFSDYVSGEVLAVEVSYDCVDGSRASIEGQELFISVAAAR